MLKLIKTDTRTRSYFWLRQKPKLKSQDVRACVIILSKPACQHDRCLDVNRGHHIRARVRAMPCRGLFLL